MDITEVVKKQVFFQNLIKKRDENLLSNAILFFCEDKFTSKIVLNLTALMIQYPMMFELFNENSAEYKKIENGSDLDTKVYPKNADKLLVSDSNEIVSESYVKPVNLPNKIFVLRNFDSSTEEAQNKLLKVLEEPPKNVFFLLSAQSEDKVLSTIKSRCDKIYINAFSKEDIQNFCQDTLAIILGNGFLGKTLELEKNENLKNVVRFAVSLFSEMKNSKQVVKFSKKFLDLKGEMQTILEVMSLCIEDMIKIKCESENLCKLTPFLQNLKDVEPEFSVWALCEISKKIENLLEKIEFNANLTVSIDNFLLEILEVKYLCK